MSADVLGRASTRLFERLPDRLFAPLASPNRHRYWALLCTLHQRRFGPDAPLQPIHGFAIRELVQDVEDELDAQDIWEAEQEITQDVTLPMRAYQVFHRFVDTGWLHVEKAGIERRVTMRPAVTQFLTQLVSFAETGPIFLSGKIRAIDMQIRQVIESDQAADLLGESAEQARRLLEHVRNTGTNVRELMQALGQELSTADYVRRFFSDYIERVFIADYRELRTKEHPLSRRQQILRAVDEIATTETHRRRLVQWYADKRANGNVPEGERRFERDIHRLQELSRIDEYLDRLDEEIRRANRRALAYLDYRLRSPRPIDQLAKHAIDAMLGDRRPTLGDPFPPGELVSVEALAEPRRQIERAPPTALRRVVPSEEQRARARLMLRAQDARSVTFPKLVRYVSEQLAGGNSVDSAALQGGSVANVRAVQALAALALAMSTRSPRLHLEARTLARGYRVDFDDAAQPMVAPIGSRGFVVSRTPPTKKGTPL